MLFMAWTGESHRPTVDMGFLGHGENTSERLAEVFRNVCSVGVVLDGVEFDPDSVNVAPIREEGKYQGQRIKLTAFLGKARIPIQVDVGFGDVVTPKARTISYPTLLDLPAPRIRTYPRETVVAEKLQAMVVLGIANSRMKDFYDLYVLAREFDFEGAILTRAIQATFRRRKTEIPHDTPLSLTEEFGRDAAKSSQWKGFVRKSGLEQGLPEFLDVLSNLREFLLPVLKSARGAAPLPKSWSAGGSWMVTKSEVRER